MGHTSAAAELAQRDRPKPPAGLMRPVAEPESPQIWMNLPEFRVSSRRLREQRVVAAMRTEPAASAFDVLRTKVLRRLRQENWTSLALTSPGPRCGKSVVALNLALSIANLPDVRVCLIDCDFRMPGLVRILGPGAARPTDQFLAGEIDLEEAFFRIGDNLAISAGDRVLPHSARLLQGSSLHFALNKVREQLVPTVILLDLPPMSAGDDVLAILPSIEAIMLIAGAGATSISDVDACERELAKITNVLGVVLNKCRYSNTASYY